MLVYGITLSLVNHFLVEVTCQLLITSLILGFERVLLDKCIVLIVNLIWIILSDLFWTLIVVSFSRTI